MNAEHKKQHGAYYTPDHVVRSLVNWAVRRKRDRLLDPACGDGRFLTVHANSVGVEQDPQAAAIVHARCPGALIHQGEFFAWAARTSERFECAAGNPPFIRYQRFAGNVRAEAARLSRSLGAEFTGLTSSWAPFMVATASLLKAGGRMAFVVPAEIGHAPYATPLLKYLLRSFEKVQLVAVREKLFDSLSEDCWLLYCDGFGGVANSIQLTTLDTFGFQDSPPVASQVITRREMDVWNMRIRPFLLPKGARELYQLVLQSRRATRLESMARVGIGYVTGANDFFHLRRSDAELWGIDRRFLMPAVRNGRSMTRQAVTPQVVRSWWEHDEPNFLLRLAPSKSLPRQVMDYLDSPQGRLARDTYKCRNRSPWYVVPDVNVPDAFLTYMCGRSASLVANNAKCVATNSVHVVRVRPGASVAALYANWESSLTELSCELEGHPLGGGMLKLEPREAARVAVRTQVSRDSLEDEVFRDGVALMRRWRHYA